MTKVQAIILAAGKGLRMNSNIPKALQTLSGKPLIQHLLDVSKLVVDQTSVVISKDHSLLESSIQDLKINWVIQDKQLGTADAVSQAINTIADDDICLILYADAPIIHSKTLKSLIDKSQSCNLVILTKNVDDPTGYGRIKRDSNNNITEIVEQQQATKQELAIKEINTGVMAIRRKLLYDLLLNVDNDNIKNEFYLTDIVKIASTKNVSIGSCYCSSNIEAVGVNDKKQLAELERLLQHKQAEDFARKGLGIKDLNRFDCRGNLKFKQDCLIDVNVIFEGDNELGKNVTIAANCSIKNAKISDNAVINANTVIENSVIGEDAAIGPFARIRPECVVGDNCRIGNFVELKKSKIGKNSKIAHLSYIGDSKIGNNVNIGAGVITCNYDGKNKHHTIIEEGAFIGASSQIIAPVIIGKNAKIGAGSTISKDVPSNSLAVSRCSQKILKK